MSRHFFPPEHHDFVATSDIRRLEIENQAFLEAKFLGDLAVFRAKMYGKLIGHGALTLGFGWASFDLSSVEAGSVATVDPFMHDALIMCGRPPQARKLPVSRIRLLTNELFSVEGEEEGVEWLARDVIVDEDDDTQYFVDVVNFQKKEALVATPLEVACYDRSLAASFVIKDDGQTLAIATELPSFTPVIGVYEDEVDRDATNAPHPFGKYTCLEDKIKALAVADSIYELIKDLDPVHSSATWTM